MLIVNYCEASPSQVRSYAYKNGLGLDGSLARRADAINNYDLLGPYYTMKTEPDNKYRYRDYNLFYDMSGLLSLIYSYCELPNDEQENITSIRDIARINTIIIPRNRVFLEQPINIPGAYKRPNAPSSKMMRGNPHELIDITHYINEIGSKSPIGVEAVVTISLLAGTLPPVETFKLGLKAINHDHLSYDMDEVSAMSVWGN